MAKNNNKYVETFEPLQDAKSFFKGVKSFLHDLIGNSSPDSPTWDDNPESVKLNVDGATITLADIMKSTDANLADLEAAVTIEDKIIHTGRKSKENKKHDKSEVNKNSDTKETKENSIDPIKNKEKNIDNDKGERYN